MARRSVVFLFTVLAAVVTMAADVETVARVFRLDFASISEVSVAVQPMLSESGSLTLHPSRSRITVQDLPEVVDRVAQRIAELDRMPGHFRIKIDLLEGRPAGDGSLPGRVRTPCRRRWPVRGTPRAVVALKDQHPTSHLR